MITFQVNGHEYRIRDFMTLGAWKRIRATVEEQGYVLLHENLVDANGDAYADIDTMLDTVAFGDVEGIREKIWTVNGVADDPKDVDGESPLAETSGFDTD